MNWVRDSVLRGIVTGQMSRRRHQPQRKCNEGTRNQDVEELIHLRKNRATRTFGGFRRNSMLWRYQRPPERQNKGTCGRADPLQNEKRILQAEEE
jgi:hypothetical protein